MNLLNKIIETPFGIFKGIFPDKRDPKSRKYYYTYQKDKPGGKAQFVDWRTYTTKPPFNQGEMGSCVRCAVVGGMEMTYRRKGIEIDFAEQQYKWDEDTDPHKGEGTTPEHVLRETLRIGQSEARFWEPYRDEFTNMAHELPDTRENAAEHKIKSFHRITRKNEIFPAIARTDGFVMASIWIDPQWFNKDIQIIRSVKYPKIILHEIYFCYDDRTLSVSGIKNSWGPWGWGWTGFCQIEEEYIMERAQDIHFVKVF